jgi:hypothetical protein
VIDKYLIEMEKGSPGYNKRQLIIRNRTSHCSTNTPTKLTPSMACCIWGKEYTTEREEKVESIPLCGWKRAAFSWVKQPSCAFFPVGIPSSSTEFLEWGSFM